MSESMMMVATKTEDFFGKPVLFSEAQDASLWLTAERAAPMLGLKDRNSVGALFRDNKPDFDEGRDFGYATLDVACSEDSESPTQRKRVLVFSLSGIELLALLVRNEVGRRARRWTVSLRAALRAREKTIVDPAKLQARIEELEARVADAHRAHVVALETQVDRAMSMSTDIAKAVASALGRRGAQKKALKALQLEVKEGQKFLPYAAPPADAPKKSPRLEISDVVLGNMLAFWSRAFSTKPVRALDALEFARLRSTELNNAFRAALPRLAPGVDVDSESLSRILRMVEGRGIDGLSFDGVRAPHRATAWRVIVNSEVAL